jgi:hypothetical protein
MVTTVSPHISAAFRLEMIVKEYVPSIVVFIALWSADLCWPADVDLFV